MGFIIEQDVPRFALKELDAPQLKKEMAFNCRLAGLDMLTGKDAKKKKATYLLARIKVLDCRPHVMENAAGISHYYAIRVVLFQRVVYEKNTAIKFYAPTWSLLAEGTAERVIDIKYRIEEVFDEFLKRYLSASFWTKTRGSFQPFRREVQMPKPDWHATLP